MLPAVKKQNSDHSAYDADNATKKAKSVSTATPPCAEGSRIVDSVDVLEEVVKRCVSTKDSPWASCVSPAWMNLRSVNRTFAKAANGRATLETMLGGPLKGVPNPVETVLRRNKVRKAFAAGPHRTAFVGGGLATNYSLASSVSFLPCGRRSVTTGDGALILWDLGGSSIAGERLLGAAPGLRVVGERHLTTGATLGNAPEVLVGSWHGFVERVSFDGGRAICTNVGHHPGPDCDIDAVAASADGLAASLDMSGAALLWDPRNHRSAGHIPSRLSSRLTVSPDGKWLAGSDPESAVQLWDLRHPKNPHSSLGGHVAPGDWISGLAFSQDGRRLLIGSTGGATRMWSLDGPQTSQCLGTHQRSVFSVAFSPDGDWGVSLCTDAVAYLWDTSQQNPRATMAVSRPDGYRRGRDGNPSNLPASFNAFVAFSPDGTRVAAAFEEHGIDVWELEKSLRDPFPSAGKYKA